jgi:glycosyltransferase involved in cell wall biosynthesis
MAKRIFILAPESPEKAGGVEHLVREMQDGLESRGYGVEVLHKGNCLPRWLQNPRTKVGRYVADTALGWYQGKNMKKLWSEEVVALISHSATGFYTPRPPGSSARFFHFYHGTYRGQAEAIRPFISPLGYWKMKWWDAMVLERLGGRGKKVLCCSDQIRDEVQYYFGYSGTTIWYPLDTEHFQPLDKQDCRRALQLPAEETIALFVGSAQPTKGFPAVQALMKVLPELRWVVAMRGDVPQEVQQNPRVTVFQDLSHSHMPSLYSAADFTVCPSRYDAFPYAVSEPLACGTPVIASPNGASSLFLREPPMDRLLVSHTDDLDGFVAAARELIRAPEFYRQAVLERVRPKLLETMSRETWWARFMEVTGL